jgi:hypothetical protein
LKNGIDKQLSLFACHLWTLFGILFTPINHQSNVTESPTSSAGPAATAAEFS